MVPVLLHGPSKSPALLSVAPARAPSNPPKPVTLHRAWSWAHSASPSPHHQAFFVLLDLSTVFCPAVWGIMLLCVGQGELLLAPGSCQRPCPEHRHPWQHHWGCGSQRGIHWLHLSHKAAWRVRWLQRAGGKESKGGEKAEGEQEEGGTGGKWREPEGQEEGEKEEWGNGFKQ